jgi:hypothetical protein
VIILNDSVRKNILIDAEADKRIQNNRAKFLAKDIPVDIDYSTMASMLVELGDVAMELISNVQLPDTYAELEFRIKTCQDVDSLKKLHENIDTSLDFTEFDKKLLKDGIAQRMQDIEHEPGAVERAKIIITKYTEPK